MYRHLRTQLASRGVIILTFVLSVTLCIVSTATGQVALINVIPAANSGETNDDAEASLAVSGTNVVIPTFTPFTAPPGSPWNGAGAGVAAPYWFSVGGGAAGTWAQNIGAYPEPVAAATGPNDQTVAFSSAGGTLYSALLSSGGNTNYIFSTGAVAGASALLAAPNGTLPFAALPDQPFVTQESVTTISAPPPAALAALGAGDVLFYGVNDLSGFPGGNTATVVRITPGPGRPGPLVFLLETTNPAGLQSSPPVRVAVASDTVYAVWHRRTAVPPTVGDAIGDIVIRRSLDLGLDTFINPGFGAAGNNVAVGIMFPRPVAGGTTIGSERLGADLSIAVDPRHPLHVYVAYVDVIGGAPVLQVRFNDAGGAAGTPWVLVGSFVNAALPALAVANNGALGLLYAAQGSDNQGNTRVVFHFAQSPAGVGVPRFRDPGPRGQFVVPGPDMNLILEDSIDPIPGVPVTFQPYYGDYHFLLAQGNTFFGAFASSNNFDGDDAVQFPNGVVFQRTDRFVDGAAFGFAPSIDPYFMTATAGADRADLSVIKEDNPDPVKVAGELTYRIRVRNLGPSAATGVILTDTLPANVNFVSASSGCSRSGSIVTCKIGNMKDGESAVRLIRVRPTAAGGFSNTATVTANETDPDPANNTATTVTTVR